ncbi:GNAT family N-acetyltransferase [Clostridium sp. 'White wine YQ']|uniref:GNAT family N-acetyltransferase n=1 Tax=Clostridium sp. 'White wine YQ' TaxID=3027474 RepID=UPI0023659CCF|nr:GNAT family N-acetyltransferase [Clostridium sp. 'White wine YQ']MDD7795181.1 GNAT family N-acetyltransferase [Clostridium sp. 'White wine YQ']
MEIKILTLDYLDAFINLDYTTFNRDVPRSKEMGLSMLRDCKDGAFMALENNNLLGFVFCRVLGDTGYIGPLGVANNLYGKGIGSKLLDKAMEYLKNKNCKLIGLEALADNPSALSLYIKKGFTLTLPTLVLRTPDTLSKSGLTVNSLKNNSSDFNEVISKISALTQKESYDFTCEIQNSLNNGGYLYYYQDGDKVLGFITYNKNQLGDMWGLVDNCDNKNEIFISLINSLMGILPPNGVTFRVNSKYKDFITFLVNNRFELVRGNIRFVLKDYEGYSNESSNRFLLRGWIV